MSADGEALPIHSVLPALIEAVASSLAVVLTAPPGAGKSTVVPTALLDAGLLGEGQLVMLEPRRIAARTCAARMAALRGEPLGATIGYQVRFDQRASSATRILVMTEGILTRRFVSDPFLDGVSVLILDELHERSVHADLALAFARELMHVREDFRIVAMSATMDADAVSRYLGDCPVIRAEGRRFPVAIEYADTMDSRPLPLRVVPAIRTALSKAPEEGDLLVFLPGAGDIRRTANLLSSENLAGRPEVIPLYGALSHAEQDRALSPGKRRRIVLSTNIAETSLTIPKVTGVVDAGLAKINRFDPNVGLDRLETTAISTASAEQRAGRAGRVAPGYVLRMWTPYEERGRPKIDTPEIRRMDPTPALLQLLAFHPGDPRAYAFFEPPDPALLAHALEWLKEMGAIEDKHYTLTDKGKALATLPAHPRLGAILIRAAEMGRLDQGASLAALASERDIRPRPAQGEPLSPLAVDFDYRADLLAEFEANGAKESVARTLGISAFTARFVLNAKQQLIGAASQPARSKPKSTPLAAGRLLLAGFPDRVCRLRAGSRREARMVGGRGVRLVADLEARDTDLFIAVEADAGKRGAHAVSAVFLASPVTREALRAEHPALLLERTQYAFDENEKRVTGETQTLFADLVIDESPARTFDPDAAAEVLAEAAARHFAALFSPDDRASALIARLRFAARVLPDLKLPDVSEAGIKSWLPELCRGERTFKAMEKLDWYAVIKSRLPYPAQRHLDEALPEQLIVPAGNAVGLDYVPAAKGDTAGPVLACRLQALFGMTKTPRIADGKIPLTIHLLAPNGRPCQVTQDLESFWCHTYREVRKELKGRYPKHYWPEDPQDAVPTNRVRPSPLAGERGRG